MAVPHDRGRRNKPGDDDEVLCAPFTPATMLLAFPVNGAMETPDREVLHGTFHR
jgi:hypothetical protein